MGVVWNPVAAPGAIASLAAFGAAIFVFVTGRARLQARLTALVLAVEGFFLSGAGWMYFMSQPEDAAGLQALFVTSMILGPLCYLFLVATLPTPLARPFASKAGRIGIVLVGLLAEGYWLTHPADFIPQMVPVWYAPWEAVIGDSFTLAWTLSGFISLYGVACSIDAWRRAAPASPARLRAKFYAVAFSARDGFLALVTLILPFLVPVPPTNTWTDMLYIWGYPAIELIFVTLMLYGVLQAQLFDIDVKLKVGVSRTVLATVFVGVFFVVSQLIQTFAAESLGYVVGAIASGLLLFALRPLERIATRVADAAMPHVSATSEYLTFRKLQVYRAALEGAFEDGDVTPKERAMLARLRDELGIAPSDADALESDVAKKGGTPA